jgi:uncharacterized membrane protein
MFHLFHPGFVHFSIAFLIFGALTEAVGLLARLERTTRFGEVLVLLGTASLLPTLATGYLAANSLSFNAEARDLLSLHETTGWGVLGVFVVLLVWKAWNQGRLEGIQRVIYAVALIAGALLAGYGGIVGGRMVYREAVGVATMIGGPGRSLWM